MADAPKVEEPSIIESLREQLLRAETSLRKPEVTFGELYGISNRVRSRLEEIYGKDSPLLSGLPARGILRGHVDRRAELIKRTEPLRRIIEALEAAPGVAKSPAPGRKIFVGHGHSHVWLQLKDFIGNHLHLPCDEFNIEPAAGMPTTTRLDAMLGEAGFAFIVMTAEEEHADGRVYARPNVIHESGLFQGKLGTPRAIILLEEGCSDFSNIKGLTHISFPHENLKPALIDVQEVLKREGFM